MSDLDTNLQEGWTAFPAAASYAGADSPTFTITESGDVTRKVYPGVRVKLQQTQGLTAYFPLEDKEPTVGTYTVANIGTPTYTAGKHDNALTLNGTNQALSITDHADFKPTGEFTIGCWFKTSTDTSTIFQSYSDNTNSNGIVLQILSGVLTLGIGNNAASTSSDVRGTTSIIDGNWHYVVISSRNNFTQMYLDGKLEASGYSVTPTYAATNYVRIGCLNVTGSNSQFFSGQIDDLFLINGYALDEQTIKAKYAADAAQGTGDITLTKYFLCTASSYSAPNTTITLYGGTDHALANATISSAYYSSQKAPYGFPLSEEKWKHELRIFGADDAQDPAATTYYNLGSRSLVVPIGMWSLEGSWSLAIARSTAQAGPQRVGLSTANNAFTDDDLIQTSYVAGGGDTSSGLMTPMYVRKSITLPVKKTYYIVGRAEADDSQMYLNSSRVPTIIRATSTLL